MTVSTLIGALPPSLGFFKLNIDGSVRGNLGRANAGGLIRNSMGSWIRGFSRSIGITHSMAVELWALRDGFVLANNLNIKKTLH